MKRLRICRSTWQAGGVALCLLAGSPVMAAAAAGEDDKALTEAVEAELQGEEAVPAHAIDVTVEEGVVTLSGRIESLAAKRAATEAAQSLRGVQAVRNELEVDAQGRTEEEIRQDVQMALAMDPVAEGYEVFVSVDNQGIVRLDGRVQSHYEKKLAGTIAANINGVTAVRNEIDLMEVADRPEHEIEEDVRSRLVRDAKLDASGIQVEVDGHRVILSGNVNSARAREWAAVNAWVTGVEQVDTSNLQVQGFSEESRQERRAAFAQNRTENQESGATGGAASPESGREEESSEASPTASDEGSRGGGSAGSAEMDQELAQSIENALEQHPRLQNADIQLAVNNGVVTLTGKVDHLKARWVAADVASDIWGVRGVKNGVKVRPEKVPGNQVLARRVRQALERDPYLTDNEVRVTATSGKVWLGGRTDSRFERARAADVASRVNGVLAIQNNIEADPDPEIYAVYSYTFTPVYDADQWPYADSEMVESIENQMFWSPFVEADEVSVTVENGVATLRGAVDSFAERRAAVENAYEGGALLVQNNLAVQPDGDDLF